MYKIIFLFIIYFYGIFYNNCISQQIESARYEFRANLLIEKAEENPKHKEMIEKQIKAFSPQFVDLILINNDIIELKWSYSNQLSSITIYSLQKNKIYIILADNELTIENFEVDTSNHISIKQLKNDTTNSIWSYELDSPNALPVTLSLTNKIDSLSNINKLIDYPEHSFISKHKVLPLDIVFGKPKTFQSLILKKNIYHYENFQSNKFYEYLENIDNQEIRFNLWNLFKFTE